ncbi:MAG: radical SAM protein [Candidatus Omnitrophota bacterium]
MPISIALLNHYSESIKERRYDRPHYPDPSLGTLFSYLQEFNRECHVIDTKLERLPLSKVVTRLESLRPSAIGFTAFTHEIESVATDASIIKERFPGVKLIIGGAHANALPEKVLSEFSVFDISVFGEGEQALIHLIDNKFEDLSGIPSIAYRKNGAIIMNKPDSPLDMDEFPILDWERFPRAPYYPTFTSRGCPYQCIFCSRPFGSKIRYRPIGSVLEEMRQIKKLYNPRYIYIWDENFCSDRQRSLELLNSMRRDLVLKDIKWFCQTHINNLDYELVQAMKSSGCLRIGIGIESGNEDMLKRIRKGTTKERIAQVVRWIRQARIPFEGYFLLGLPYENQESCRETIDFAVKLNPDFPVFGIVVPYPGTEIYNLAQKGEGHYRIISHKWSDYNKIMGKAMELEGLSRRELELFQFYGYASVLFKNFRFFDILRFLFQFYNDILTWIGHFFLRGKHHHP